MMRLACLIAVMALGLASTAVAAPDGKNRKVMIENVSSQSIRELYASPVTAGTWEEDMLGDRTIPPGADLSANIDNGTNECNYDMKVVMANGTAIERRAVNVCAVSAWTIGESGNRLH
jgi:hypothetical protein